MDIIITYVNGLDPEWQKDYARTVGGDVMQKRFRDWGTLKFLFRAIEKHIAFVRKVHLVVARESQIPEWVDRDKVNVVLHRDIIPEQFLPIFNSSSIEMFLHRIPDLDEEILYFNDDMFPMMDCTHDDFFPEGKPVISMTRHLFVAGNRFRYIVRSADRLARQSSGKSWEWAYLRPQHICYALLKSSCDELYDQLHEQIYASITRVRELTNYNIYLFSDYIHLMGRSVNRRMSKKHFSMAVASVNEITSFIRKPSKSFVCINDVQMTDEKFRLYHEGILSAFEDILPEKSHFEK